MSACQSNRLVTRLGHVRLDGYLNSIRIGLVLWVRRPKTLADSLMTAFDATVIGLAAGGIAFAVSRLRKRWYEDYLSTLEVLIESLMEVLAHGPRFEKN